MGRNDVEVAAPAQNLTSVADGGAGARTPLGTAASGTVVVSVAFVAMAAVVIVILDRTQVCCVVMKATSLREGLKDGAA